MKRKIAWIVTLARIEFVQQSPAFVDVHELQIRDRLRRIRDDLR
jgi:hypothetical protein